MEGKLILDPSQVLFCKMRYVRFGANTVRNAVKSGKHKEENHTIFNLRSVYTLDKCLSGNLIQTHGSAVFVPVWQTLRTGPDLAIPKYQQNIVKKA